MMIDATVAPKVGFISPFGTTVCTVNHINARRELRLEAGARDERTLEAVRSTPVFGAGPAHDLRLSPLPAPPTRARPPRSPTAPLGFPLEAAPLTGELSEAMRAPADLRGPLTPRRTSALQGMSSDTPVPHNQNPRILGGLCRAGRGPLYRDGLPESATSAARRRNNPRRGRSGPDAR